MFQHIVLPLDGSASAEQAIPVAARIARASGGSLLLVQVVTTPIDNGMYLSPSSVIMQEKLETSHDAALSYLTGVTYAEELTRTIKQIEVLSGDPVESILSLLHTKRYDLIVLCRHEPAGRRGRRRGRVAQEIARQSPVPALVLCAGGKVLPSRQAGTARPIRALVGLDGSALAEEVLVPTAHLVAVLSVPAHGVLHLLHVTDGRAGSGQRERSSTRVKQRQQEAEAYLQAVTDRLHQRELAQLQVAVTSAVVVGRSVADTIIRQAEQVEHADGADTSNGFDLIALATHGRGGIQRLVMGSVTRRIFDATRLPLLIVRPQRP